MHTAHPAVPLFLLFIPVLSTLLGGWLALRARRWLPLLMGLGAGLLLGAAFLDLLPEAITLAAQNGQSVARVLGITLASMLAFLALDAVLDRFAGGRGAAANRKTRGRVGGTMLVLHSFRDGMVIGAAYAASHAAGAVVAFGIIAHDIGDGMNTVILSTAGEKPGRTDYLFLAADALAPLAGGLLSLWWVQSPADAALLLAVAAGFFLQMASSDFLPNLREYGASRWYVVPAVLCGAGLIYIANTLLSHIGG